MLRDTRWMVGALAAALWIAPAAAQTGSTSAGAERPHATGSGADPTRSATEPNTAAGSASDTAGRAADRAGAAAGTMSDKAESTADRAGDKAHAMGQQASSESARTLAKLHDGNQAEVEAGTWMKEHAQNDKVKDFAKKMVDDHGSMDKDVMSFAQKKGIDLTSAPKAGDADKAKAQHTLDEIKNMSGAQADRAYMNMMVQDHQKDVREVREAERQAKSSQDKELASLLGKSAKKMESHLKDAQKIQRDLTQRQARTPGSSSSR